MSDINEVNVSFYRLWWRFPRRTRRFTATCIGHKDTTQTMVLFGDLFDTNIQTITI